MIQHDILQWWVFELLQVLISPSLFSVFFNQAPSSDLPLKHVDTMVSILYFRLFW